MKFQKSNRLAYLNFLRAKYESLTGETLVRSLPYIMGIDPSSICQLRCPLCPTGVENEGRKDGKNLNFRNRTMMEADLFDSLLAELGDYLFLIMFYNWGEPLLNKNLPSFIRKTKAFNISTEIHTNLSLRLTDGFIEELLSSGIDDICASIDGFSPESYGIYRRGGSFQLVKTNIERLVKTRDRLGLKTNITWNFLVFSFNEHEIDVTRQFCNELGINFNRREAFIDNPDWLPSYRKGELDSPKTASASDQTPAPKKKPRRASPCAWHYSYSVVNADGAVSPCCVPWEQKQDFGTVQAGLVSFSDIWNNNLYRKSRGAFARKQVTGLEKLQSICLRCPYDENIQNLYAPSDQKIRQHCESSPDLDPTLAMAFHLIDDKERFIDFFKSNLINDFSPLPTQDATLLISGIVSKKEEISQDKQVEEHPGFLKSRLIRAHSILHGEGFHALLQRTWSYVQRYLSRAY